jgi:macrolide-specific efflux system membrane fusion protein
MDIQSVEPKRRFEKKILIVLAGVLFFILSGLVFNWKLHQNQQYLVHPKLGEVKEAIYGLGVLKSEKVYEYKLGTAVTITKILAREGDFIEKGKKILEAFDVPPLRAPFSGVITYLPFHENENVFPQQIIARIEDLKNRYLEVSLEQQGALRVKIGQQVKISFESFRNELFSGVVDRVYPYQGQFIVRINVSELPEQIVPGMTADVSIEVAQKSQALLVPMKAISNGHVTLVKNRKKNKIQVKLGAGDGQWVEILDQHLLTPEDQVLLPKD